MFPTAKSGFYTIRDPCLIGHKLFTSSRLTVYCDMETDGGGWIVIQRRNASMGWVNFTRRLVDYESGFGDLDGEFWIGLKNIYELTNQQTMALRLSVWNDSENAINWNYQHFAISNGRYAIITLSGGSGNGSGGSGYGAFSKGGSSTYYFNTYDYYTGQNNCGYNRQSGWWYYYSRNRNTYSNNCGEYANLNGRHQPSGLHGTDSTGERLVWRTSTGYQVFTHSEMKIRPQSCPLS